MSTAGRMNLSAWALQHRTLTVFAMLAVAAAGVWASSGIGLAVGGGLYFAACAGTALVLLILVAIKQIERTIIDRAFAEGFIRPEPAAVKTLASTVLSFSAWIMNVGGVRGFGIRLGSRSFLSGVGR